MSEIECTTLIICLTIVSLTIIIISLLIFIYYSYKLKKQTCVPKIINYDKFNVEGLFK